MGGPKALLAPADEREPEIVMPVSGVERDRLARGGNRFRCAATSVQNERQRAPRFAGRRIEPTCFACMVHGVAQRVDIRRRIHPCRFKSERAGIGLPDVSGRLVGLRAQCLSECSTGARDGNAIQRLERGAPLDKGAIWSKQRVERHV